MSTFSSPMTTSQIEAFHTNGYHIADALIPDDLIARLMEEAAVICRGERGRVDGLPESVHGDSEAETLQRVLAIHFPHKVSELYTEFLVYPPISDILTHLIGPNVKCMQSLLFIKPPGMPGQAWHQDEIPIPTRDRSLTAAWVALDDTTVENGCLWILPGSNRPGILYERLPHNDPRYDGTPQATRIPYSEEDACPVEISRGSVLFFNGYLLHRSLNNVTAGQYRRNLVLHYMSAESFLRWRGADDYRDIVIVAGSDPYDYKGTVDESRAFVRKRD